MRKAWLSLPLLTSQRGDSGTNQMRKNWNTEGIACRREGMRHDHSLLILDVPNAVHEALLHFKSASIPCAG